MPDAETQTQCVSAVAPPPPRWVAWRPPRLGFGAPHPPDPLHHHQHHHTGPLQEHGMAFNDAVRRLSHVLAQEHAAKAGGAPLEDTYFAATATDIVHAQCSAAAAETGDSVQPDDTPVVGDRAWRKLCAHHPRLIPPPPQLQIVDYGRLTTEASEAPSTSVVGSDAPLPDDAGVVDRVTQWLHDALRWFERFLAGGIAGALAKSVIAPGDRVKILFQVDPSREFSLARAVRVAVLIVEHAGVQGLWTGHCATLMRVVPQAATNFMAFETFHPRIERWLNGPAPASDPDHVLLKKSQGLFRKALPSFLAGAMAGATATTCTYPLDLIRARYAAHWDTTKRYPSYSVALREVVQLEGFTGLYAGLRPTLSGIIPYAGVSFGSFATLKATVRKAQGLEDEAPLPTYQQVVVGASAGLVAQSATYPLDIVRRRMQVHPARYPTMGSVFTDILRNEGPKALYKGLSMNWIKGPIAHGIAFTANDKLKARIHNYHVEVATADAAPDPDALPVWAKLVCGGMAGGLAKLWTLPFDRVKIMWAIGRHTGGGGPEEQLHTAREMLTDSSRRMYQGAGAMMMRTVPYAAVTYATFDSYQRLFERLVFAEEPSIFTDACAGAAAASTATVLFHPFDLLRAQSATHDQPFYTTARGGLRRLCREGGGIRALGHGLMPAVVGIAPLSAAGFAMYHGLTDRYMGPDPHFTDRLFYGAVAGITGQFVTYPLNVVRRRAMVDDLVHASVLANLRHIHSHEGLFRGLYHRLPIMWVMGPTTVGLSYALNDSLRDAMLMIRRRIYTDLPFAAGPSA